MPEHLVLEPKHKNSFLDIALKELPSNYFQSSQPVVWFPFCQGVMPCKNHQAPCYFHSRQLGKCFQMTLHL